MTENVETKPKQYKVYKRPKDAISDDEYDLTCDYKEKQETVSKEEVSVWLFLESKWDDYYPGCFGQQSYSYALSNDIIIAYNYLNMDKDWFLWLLSINELSPTQFFWIQEIQRPQPKHILKEEFILKQISMMMINRFKQNNNLCTIKLKPYKQHKDMNLAINKIKLYANKYFNGFVEKQNKNIITSIASKQWADKFANKCCLHRYTDNIEHPSLFEKYKIFDINDLSECKGFICKNKEEILKAYDILIKQIGHNNVLIKDCFGGGGDDIFFFNSKQDIINKFVWWNEYYEYMEIEEDLRYNIQQEIEKVEFVGISFYENKIIGCGHEQIIIDNAIFDGSKTYKNKIMTKKLQEISINIMNKIGTKYVGGFDFGIQLFKNKNIAPKIYLIDMNTARYTSTIQTFIIMKKFKIEDKFFIRKNLKISKNAVFNKLINSYSNLLFNIKTGVGTYFHLFHPNDQSAIISIFGDNEQDSFNTLNKILSINSLNPSA